MVSPELREFTSKLSKEKYVRSLDLLGPTLTIDKNTGKGDISGDLATVETVALGMLDRNHAFFKKRTRREFNEIPPSELGNTRSDVMNKIESYPKSMSGDRANDYQMVAFGFMQPWARRTDNIISKVDTIKVTNPGQLINAIRGIFNQRPLLKTVVAKIWNEKVKNGSITRYKADKWKKLYL